MNRIAVGSVQQIGFFHSHFTVAIALDSGAEANCITVRECRRLGIPIEPSNQSAVAVDKVTKVSVVGEIKTAFERNGLEFHFEGLVCSKLSNEIIGGIPFLKKNNIVQDLNSHRISVNNLGKIYHIMEIPELSPSQNTSLQSRIVHLGARKTALLPNDFMDIKLSPDCDPDQSYILHPSIENLVNSCFPQEVQAVGNIVRLSNVTKNPILIPEDTHILRITNVCGNRDMEDMSDDDYKCHIEALEAPQQFDPIKDILIDKSLTKKQIERLNSLHMKFKDVFNGDLREGYNGRSGNYEVDFNWIQNTRPPVNNTKFPSFCNKKEDKDLLQAMIDKLEFQNKCAKAKDLGIIPRFASPVMLVKKNKVKSLPSGKYECLSIPEKLKYNRFIQCLQKLNEYVEKIPSQNIDLEETISKVGAAKCVITADLTDSFQQRWICKDKQPYFAFHSPYKGTYIMLRSGQGFLNQSEELHNMMSDILSAFVAQGWCIIFHDNIYVIGSDVDTTIGRWEQVLRTLAENNLKISPEKTSCFPAELDLLGWIKRDRFLCPDPHRQNALLKSPLPSTTKQLRSYLGSYQTFYKCKPKIREILGPLQELASNKPSSRKIEWTKDLVDAFNNSKEELKHLDKLYIPSPDDQLVSTFDFSEKGVSGTLWAKVGDQYFTITNVSAKCPEAMKNWPPCDGEAAAVYVSTKSPHMRTHILASNKPVYALVDNKTVYEASKLLKKGKLSTSERVSKLLTAISDLRLEFRHNSGKLGHNDWDDFHSRQPPACHREDCQTCQFVQNCADMTVNSLVIGNVAFDQRIIQEPISIPLKSRAALRQLQEEDQDLIMVKNYLLSGKQPNVNDNTKNDIKKYLSAGTKLAPDGVLYVNKISNKLVSYDRIIIPRSFGYGFLLAMHHNLACLTINQLEKNFSRAFFTLDLNKLVKYINDNCTRCLSFKQLPKFIDCFKPNEVPEAPGTSFTVDVIKMEKKLIIASVENFSGYLITNFIGSESFKDLEAGIISSILPFKSGNMSKVRVDQAPGFSKLSKCNRNLQSVGIHLELGEPKNKNSLAIADQKIKELEQELKKDSRCLDIAKLQSATNRVNEKIRKENLSSKEVLFRRNQYTHENIDIQDSDIAIKKMEDRSNSNEISAKSKANTKLPAPVPDVSRGKLVFLRDDISKHKAREVYVIADAPCDSDYIFIQKLLYVLSDLPAKLQSKRYKVKKTAVIVAPNQDFYIEYPSGIPSPDPDLEKETLIISESKDQLEEPEIWEAIFESPKDVPHHSIRPPDTTTLTGPEFMQHFPSSPPVRRISLGSESIASLSWDEHDSFQAFAAAPFPSPPEAECTGLNISPAPDLSFAEVPVPHESSDSTQSDEVFTDNVSSPPSLPLRAPVKKKRQGIRHHRRRLMARSFPGRPITRSTTEEELSNQESSRYQLRPRRPAVKNPDFVYDF